MKRRQVDIHDLLDVFFVNHDGWLIQSRLCTGYRRVIWKHEADVGPWSVGRIGEVRCGVPVDAAVAWIKARRGNVRLIKVAKEAP